MDLGPVKTPWEARAQSAVAWVCGGVGVVALLLWVLGIARPAVTPLFVIPIALVVISPRLIRRAAFKQLAGLRDIGFRVCPWCFYDLRSLDVAGTCPECGEEFDPETLGEEWRRRLEPNYRVSEVNCIE